MASGEVYEKCEKVYEKAKRYPKFWIGFGILLAVILLIWLPPWRVSHFEINNATVEATLENQYRATFAQILGGVAIAIGLYYTWRRIGIAEEDLKATQKNLEVAQEGQITERFTRAVDQLGAVDKAGNPAIEIRLGGIYALERIAYESDRDYWPIMEILTAYIRMNSSVVDQNIKEQKKVTLDIQAILTVISRRKYSMDAGESRPLILYETYLVGANLGKCNLARSGLKDSNLSNSFLRLAVLTQASLVRANLSNAFLRFANLFNAVLTDANLENANVSASNLEAAYFKGANLKNANFEKANLKGAHSLSFDQLSKAKTLYKAQLDEGLEEELRAKGFGHLLDDMSNDDTTEF